MGGVMQRARRGGTPRLACRVVLRMPHLAVCTATSFSKLKVASRWLSSADHSIRLPQPVRRLGAHKGVSAGLCGHAGCLPARPVQE